MRKILSNLYYNILLSIVTLIILGYIDLHSGFELSFQFFYFIPIFIISSNYRIHNLSLLIFSALASIVWFLADYYSGHKYSSSFYYFWNTISRFIVFSFLSIALNSNLKKQFKINILNVNLANKSKMVLESINYAKSIQQAVNPSFLSFQVDFPNSFLFYRPKDILSGDFFWFYKINDKILFALVDCTGHGVPGSMLNIIGNMLLNKIVIENQIYSPAQILMDLNSEILNLFRRGNDSIDDGMDVSMFLFEPEQMKLTASQTSQSSVVVKNNQIIEIKYNFFSIGGLLSKIKKIEYLSDTFFIKHGDVLYLYTDGYLDQFGSDQNTKFGVQKFYNLIKHNIDKAIDIQQYNFENAFDEWKKEISQTDDVTLIGIKF